MVRILCNISECIYNKLLEESETHYPDSNYKPAPGMGTYYGECTKDDIEIYFTEEEVQGDYLIKHKLPQCISATFISTYT